MLDIIALGIHAIQALFAIIVIGLTGHSMPLFHSANHPHSLNPSSRQRLQPLTKFLRDLCRRLDPPHPHFSRPRPQILPSSRARLRNRRPQCTHHAFLVRGFYRRRSSSP